jgi:hypothetical protein
MVEPSTEWFAQRVRPLADTIRASLSETVRKSPWRWHFTNKVTRIEVIQRSIKALRARCYLEIGVKDGTCFCSLTAPEKIGVDPIAPQPAVALEMQKPGVKYFALTSDEFFIKVAPQVLARGVDVVFIDGLHTFQQAYRDCINSLQYLNPGGLILLHDCLPNSEAASMPAKSYEEAWKINGPNWDGFWMGDVWKAIVVLRTLHADLRACVLNCDFGLGLVYVARSESALSLSRAEIDEMGYSALAGNTRRLLGLRKPVHLLGILRKLQESVGDGRSTGARPVHEFRSAPIDGSAGR